MSRRLLAANCLVLFAVVLVSLESRQQLRSNPASSSSSDQITTAMTTGNIGTKTKFRTSARGCKRLDLKDPKVLTAFKSQSREDLVLMGWFNGLCDGTYIEMGALDGVKFSNSFAFNKHLNWKGLMVELNPANYKGLVKNRKNELATVHAGVCNEKRTLHFMKSNGKATGGFWEFSAPKFREDWWPGKTIKDTTEVTCLPMQDILRENLSEVKYFDFWSLDVEGAEMEVLRSVDYSEVGFGIIFVEADDSNIKKNTAVLTFLASKGYIYLKDQERSMWFANKDFSDIYDKVLHADS